jgi:hypothetical protein
MQDRLGHIRELRRSFLHRAPNTSERLMVPPKATQGRRYWAFGNVIVNVVPVSVDELT